MLNKRIIPRLDIKGPNLVKGIHLEGLRVLGNPNEFAKYYYQQGADEIIFMDVVASLYQRNNLENIISDAAKSVFIPITVGGGIRNLNDINRLLRSGADKVSINTGAIQNPLFIKEAAENFGSSTIVVSIEVSKHNDGYYYCYTDNGREETNINLIDWIKKVQDLGAGEILLTSIDNEGTGEGFDEYLLSQLNNKIDVPLIIHGGIGKLEQVKSLFKNFQFSGIALGSILHYGFCENNNTTPSTSEGNTSFLSEKKLNRKINPVSIVKLKETLSEKYPIRI